MDFLACMEIYNYLCNIILELLSASCIGVWLNCTADSESAERGPAPMTIAKSKHPRIKNQGEVVFVGLQVHRHKIIYYLPILYFW